MAVERRRSEAGYKEEFERAKGSFDKIVKGDGTVYFKKIKYGGVARLLVLSEAKKEKEEAMDTLKEKRFLEDVGKLKASVFRGSVMLLPKIQISRNR
jgi:hypothetical protein